MLQSFPRLSFVQLFASAIRSALPQDIRILSGSSFLLLLFSFSFSSAAISSALLINSDIERAYELYNHKKFDEALKIVMPLAEKGDHLAEDLLADYWRYEKHKGTELEFQRHQQLALQGNVLEQFIVGTMYETAFGVERNDAEAFKWYRKAAEQGSVVAQRYLGWMYEQGLGTEKNEKEAFKWYEKAAQAHEPRSIFKLAFYYDNGIVVKKDSAKATEYYKASLEYFSYLANLGSAFDQYRLGYMQQCGLGQSKNDSEALKWYLKSAEQNDSSAMNNIAWMYLAGERVKRDPVKALEWYKKMAATGSAEGYFNIAIMYESGQGVSKNDDEAIAYFKKAADSLNDQIEEFDRKAAVDALYRIGMNYKNRHDIIEAAKWFSKAAELNHYDSKLELKNMPDYP